MTLITNEKQSRINMSNEKYFRPQEFFGKLLIEMKWYNFSGNSVHCYVLLKSINISVNFVLFKIKYSCGCQQGSSHS